MTHIYTPRSLRPAVKQPLICSYYFKCFYVSLVAVMVALYAVNPGRYGSTLNAVPGFTTVNRYGVTEDTANFLSNCTARYTGCSFSTSKL